MAGHPVRFFFPQPKLDKEAQTPLLFAIDQREGSIVSRLRSSAVQRILFQDPRPSNNKELCYLLDFNSRTGFFFANLKNERFDLLTPPSTLFDDFPVGFYVNFYNAFFQLTSSDKTKAISYDYEKAFFPIIESLETGQMTRELVSILRGDLEIEGTLWEDGHLLCEITDFRLSSPVRYRRMLQLSDDIISYCIEKKQRHTFQCSLLEAERKILTFVHSTVCVDPSPDVARVQSVIDRRHKQWRRVRALDKREMELILPVTPVKAAQAHITLCPLKGSIVIPDAIFKFLRTVDVGSKRKGRVVHPVDWVEVSGS
jgi:hypothetical protein